MTSSGSASGCSLSSGVLGLPGVTTSGLTYSYIYTAISGKYITTATKIANININQITLPFLGLIV